MAAKHNKENDISKRCSYSECRACLLMSIIPEFSKEIWKKSESPDWLNADNTIGLEVTEAIGGNDAEIRGFNKKYLGKNAPERLLISLEKKGNGFIKTNGKVDAVMSPLIDSEMILIQIKEAIIKKHQLLNKSWKTKCKDYVLAIEFDYDIFSDNEISQYVEKAISLLGCENRFSRIIVIVGKQGYILCNTRDHELQSICFQPLSESMIEMLNQASCFWTKLPYSYKYDSELELTDFVKELEAWQYE